VFTAVACVDVLVEYAGYLLMMPWMVGCGWWVWGLHWSAQEEIESQKATVAQLRASLVSAETSEETNQSRVRALTQEVEALKAEVEAAKEDSILARMELEQLDGEGDSRLEEVCHCAHVLALGCRAWCLASALARYEGVVVLRPGGSSSCGVL